MIEVGATIEIRIRVTADDGVIRCIDDEGQERDQFDTTDDPAFVREVLGDYYGLAKRDVAALIGEMRRSAT